MPSPRVLLAAGGTGGHIYPAIALAEALRERDPQVQIQFVCGDRPAELQIYRRLGIEPWILPISHNRPGLMNRIRFWKQMFAAWRVARRLLRRAPVDIAVGFGSYVSVPPLLAARRSGARLILHEQNVRLGAANRLLARFAQTIATADEPGPGFPKGRTVRVGNPVRPDMLKPADRDEARRHFKLKPDRLVCLCVGGSQGAVGLNKILIELIGRMAEPDSNAGRWQLLWSTGTANYAPMLEAVKRLGVDPEEHALTPYIERMGLAYAAADLVLARAGALTLAELTALGKPAILVPLPTSKGDHQRQNAEAIAATGAAVVLDQNDANAAKTLEEWMVRWAEQPDILMTMSEAAKRLGKADAAQIMAKMVMESAGVLI